MHAVVPDYMPFVKNWKTPSGGLERFLIRFLSEDQDIAFQHIGVWTIEQFLDGGGNYRLQWNEPHDLSFCVIDERLINLIGDSHPILESVQRIVNKAQTSKAGQNDNVEDMDGDINAIAKRVLYTLQQVSSKEFSKKTNSK